MEGSGTSSNDGASGEVEEKGGKGEKGQNTERQVNKRPAAKVDKSKSKKTKDGDGDLTALGTCKGNEDDENDEPPVEEKASKKGKKTKGDSSKGDKKKHTDKKHHTSKSSRKGKKNALGKMILVPLKVNRLKKFRKFLRQACQMPCSGQRWLKRLLFSRLCRREIILTTEITLS